MVRQYNLKQIRLTVLILIVLASGCQPTKNQEVVKAADSVSNNKVDTQDKSDGAKSTDNGDRGKEFSEFEIIFEHEDKEQSFRQRLGVTWVTSDSIEFRLLSEDELCDTDYWGHAKNKYADMDPESDEDETGDSYLASEYVTEKETYQLKLRISLNKDRARITFVDKSGEDTDCIPTPGLVLINKNAR
jgi:hypothetical protein